ncbi:MAG: hypothetical protein OXG04_02530 [Acidobacteria bacterium]|nr:hypothetical protein [Acidobacteriota bacterium]
MRQIGTGGQGNDAGGHTHASACLLAARDAASLTPAFATHRSCRAITPHTLDDLPGIVPNLDDLSDSGDRCLRW